ncbi:MAG: sucrose-6-phosphate hydrolase [Lachnospiraceae bacterium]|nr:sucrose-6-phosphate hydrolase [Lachnospiraceae bacterium]MDN4742288.1 sucrose-6-phosphate hydrolase [Lachnospiraceae bacterium C1.1]
MREPTREEKYRVLKGPEEIEGLYKKITKSVYRQNYHMQPVTGLLNDPNGFVYYDGYWHLFYQWCPWGAFHGLKYWYHVVSEDLIKWKNKGVFLKPDSEFDNKGVYSGTALPTSDRLELFYTGNHRDDDWTRCSYTCLAKLNEDSGEAEKEEKPLFGPADGYTEHQRDPKIIYNAEKKKYYILLGAQTNDMRGCGILYESNDFTGEWHFAGELKVPGFEKFGFMWECPSIQHIGDKDVLFFCPQGIKLPGHGEVKNHNGYIVGKMDYDNLTFTPEMGFRFLDEGFDFYAAQCCEGNYSDEHSVLIGWMGLPDSAYPTDEEDWSGCMTVVRELAVEGNRLIQRPLRGLESLKGEKLDPKEKILPKSCKMEITNLSDDFSLKLFCDENSKGGLKIKYNSEENEIFADRSHLKRRFNSEFGEERNFGFESPLQKIEIFIDSSSVEIFFNDGEVVFTSRVFPTEIENHFDFKGNGKVRIWDMNPAVKDDFIV